MQDVETILKALMTFDGYDAMLYDAKKGVVVRFQDVVDFVTWQNSEIEQLKQEISGYVADKEIWISGYKGAQAENESLKAEIERLTEELEVKKKECREIADDYQEMGTFYYNETVKTAELQKQVDELNQRCEIAEGTKSRLTIFDRMAIHDKAVKDTTKEISTELLETKIKIGNDYFVFADNIKVIAKNKGVEVE